MRKAYKYNLRVWIEAPTEEAAKDRLIQLMETEDTVMEVWELMEEAEDGDD
jgi:hypothetical protein